jgi:predicted aspartyl protease
MPAYDSVAFVSLRNTETGATKTEVPMLLDTGADATLLPGRIVTDLGIGFLTKSYEICGFEGQTSVAYAVRAEMIFLGLTFRGQFLIVEEDRGIIGRNVLNAISLTFNGPKLTWDGAR